MGGKPVGTVLNRPDERAWPALESKVEISPLIQQPIVKTPNYEALGKLARVQPWQTTFPRWASSKRKASPPSSRPSTAPARRPTSKCIGKEKLGGGYITVVIKGDVAAVKAAVEAGVAKVGGLGKLIAGHVIARPSAAVLSLLPKA